MKQTFSRLTDLIYYGNKYDISYFIQNQNKYSMTLLGLFVIINIRSLAVGVPIHNSNNILKSIDH